MPEKELTQQELHLLKERFPKLTDEVIFRHQSILVGLLQKTCENPPDYSAPGEWGERADPHMIYVWRSGATEWEELVLKGFEPCDSIVIEVDFRWLNVKCPPADGFAALVDDASNDARRIARAHKCPEECGGSYIDIIYKHWFCQEDDAVVEIQLQKLCNVA